MDDRYLHKIKFTNIMAVLRILWITLLLFVNQLQPIVSHDNEQPIINKCLIVKQLSSLLAIPSSNADEVKNYDDDSEGILKLKCANDTLDIVNYYIVNTKHNIYNEIELENINTSGSNKKLIVSNENAVVALAWRNSGIQTQHMDLLFANSRFIRLRSLDMSSNYIESINNQHFFVSRYTLRKLNFAKNMLTQFQHNVFYDLDNLNELYLNDNQLKSIVATDTNGGNLFVYLTKLLHLDLANNSIDDLPRSAFNGLDSLTHLNLAHNKLSVVPFQIFKHLPNMSDLNLAHNNLRSFLDSFFAPNPKLIVLRLNDNSIELLSKHSLFGLKRLQTLDLSANQLKTIDRNAFDSLTQLRQLNLSNNLLATVSSTLFSALVNLERLDMSRNQYKLLPNGIFANQYKLNELILEETALEQLGNWIARDNTTVNLEILANLRTVVIRNNKLLCNIESSTFSNTPAVEQLILSGNCLSTVPKELGELSKLQVLDVSDNNLISIPWQLGNLPQLKQMNLLQNDFSCDCRIYWIVAWVEKMQTISTAQEVAMLNEQLARLKCRLGYEGDMLHVLQKLYCTRPVILQSSESKMYALRTDAVLDCLFAGNPAANIIWVTPTSRILRYHADPDVKPVLFEPNANNNGGGQHQLIEFQMLTDNRLNFTSPSKAAGVSLMENGSLKVHNISRKDSGIYTCYGYNIMGNASADIR